jgi:glyoxylase-like metal-dependent hydrolase (beta-lactamase superfamily II)/8-oxo-dGTP pyrophosphatase MutT (NUDIX family)
VTPAGAPYGDVVPRAAATVAVLRPGRDGLEVLLTHRPATMAFAAGLHVFPGGAVDAIDADPRLLTRSSLDPDACERALVGELPPDRAAAVHVAAIRELFEEAGVLLARHGDGRELDLGHAVTADAVRRARQAGTSEAFLGLVEALDLVLSTHELVPLSRWVTPPVLPRRFDARFFAAALPAAGEASFVGDEVASHDWMRPVDALEAMAAGRIELWLPTSATLQQLRDLHDLDEARDRLAPVSRPTPPLVSEVTPIVTRLCLSGAGGVPGQSVNAYLVGRRRMVLVDPGDPSDGAAEAALATASAGGAEIVAIALTQPAPDHAGGGESLALRLGVPIFAAPGGARQLPHETGALEDGQILSIGDVPLRVHATPGIDPDHLAFEVLEDGGPVLVGDLLGPGPSRAIVGSRDETALAASRRLVERMERTILLPGH